jgi:hypothetical protein
MGRTCGRSAPPSGWWTALLRDRPEEYDRRWCRLTRALSMPASSAPPRPAGEPHRPGRSRRGIECPAQAVARRVSTGARQQTALLTEPHAVPR